MNFPKNKWESLEWLRERDFNIPKCSLLTTRAQIRGLIVGEKFSIRTFREGGILAPFFPNITFTESLRETLLSLIKQNCKIIVSEPIDPRQCLVRGNFMKPIGSFSNSIIELLPGSGTVRDLEKASAKELISFKLRSPCNILRDKYLTSLNFLIRDGYSISKELESFVLEWSIYSIPLGIKKDPLIYWEVRKC